MAIIVNKDFQGERAKEQLNKGGSPIRTDMALDMAEYSKYNILSKISEDGYSPDLEDTDTIEDMEDALEEVVENVTENVKKDVKETTEEVKSGKLNTTTLLLIGIGAILLLKN